MSDSAAPASPLTNRSSSANRTIDATFFEGGIDIADDGTQRRVEGIPIDATFDEKWFGIVSRSCIDAVAPSPPRNLGRFSDGSASNSCRDTAGSALRIAHIGAVPDGVHDLVTRSKHGRPTHEISRL